MADDSSDSDISEAPIIVGREPGSGWKWILNRRSIVGATLAWLLVIFIVRVELHHTPSAVFLAASTLLIPVATVLSSSQLLIVAQNVLSWIGWIMVGIFLLIHWIDLNPDLGMILWLLLPALETLCCLELFRLAGKANLLFGVVLHYTRMFVILFILPEVSRHYACHLVVFAWTVTEICRYPAYIYKSNRLSALRYFIPVLTFPAGALGEAWACYVAMDSLVGLPKTLAAVQIFVNIVGGGAMYPQLFRRGIGELRSWQQTKRK